MPQTRCLSPRTCWTSPVRVGAARCWERGRRKRRSPRCRAAGRPRSAARSSRRRTQPSVQRRLCVRSMRQRHRRCRTCCRPRLLTRLGRRTGRTQCTSRRTRRRPTVSYRTVSGPPGVGSSGFVSMPQSQHAAPSVVPRLQCVAGAPVRACMQAGHGLMWTGSEARGAPAAVRRTRSRTGGSAAAAPRPLALAVRPAALHALRLPHRRMPAAQRPAWRRCRCPRSPRLRPSVPAARLRCQPLQRQAGDRLSTQWQVRPRKVQRGRPPACRCRSCCPRLSHVDRRPFGMRQPSRTRCRQHPEPQTGRSHRPSGVCGWEEGAQLTMWWWPPVAQWTGLNRWACLPELLQSLQKPQRARVLTRRQLFSPDLRASPGTVRQAITLQVLPPQATETYKEKAGLKAPGPGTRRRPARQPCQTLPCPSAASALQAPIQTTYQPYLPMTCGQPEPLSMRRAVLGTMRGCSLHSHGMRAAAAASLLQLHPRPRRVLTRPPCMARWHRPSKLHRSLLPCRGGTRSRSVTQKPCSQCTACSACGG